MSGTGNLARRASAGFTLIEMLVVLAVAGLIAGLVFPSLEKSLARIAFDSEIGRARLAARNARAQAIRTGRPAAMAGTLNDRPAVFFADGSSSGGQVSVSHGRSAARWRIDSRGLAIEERP